MLRDIVTTMKRIPIGLSQPQHERLRREASRRRVSVAALVREAVDRTFPDDDEARRAAWERSLEVIGKYHGGPSDVSERHDEYLADIYYDEMMKKR